MQEMAFQALGLHSCARRDRATTPASCSGVSPEARLAEQLEESPAGKGRDCSTPERAVDLLNECAILDWVRLRNAAIGIRGAEVGAALSGGELASATKHRLSLSEDYPVNHPICASEMAEEFLHIQHYR